MTSMLNTDVVTNAWGCVITLPKGTRVHEIKGPGGGWVVSSEALLAELTGNTHDPKYRYLWIDPSFVTSQ